MNCPTASVVRGYLAMLVFVCAHTHALPYVRGFIQSLVVTTVAPIPLVHFCNNCIMGNTVRIRVHNAAKTV